MIVHIDMDAFFASVEQLDAPHLMGKSVIVGGNTGRGVVAAASYEARAKGVRSAMPIFRARQLCPEAVIVPPRKDRYQAISRTIMSLLTSVSPLVEPVSIDEAYVDITGCDRLWGKPEEIAVKIKEMVKANVHLTCSVGVAPVKFLAKIASDFNKPDGIKIIMPEEVSAFIQTLPIEKVPGVGKKTLPALTHLSVRYLGDINAIPITVLSQKFGKYGRHLKALAMGRENNPVVTRHEHKSMSTETTLHQNTRDMSLLKKYLLQQTEDVARQLRGHHLKARTVFIKLTYGDFKKLTRSITLDMPTQTSTIIYRQGVLLLEQIRLENDVRLIGIGASSLSPETFPVQQELFKDNRDSDTRWQQVDKALDRIYQRYGRDAVAKAHVAGSQTKE